MDGRRRLALGLAAFAVVLLAGAGSAGAAPSTPSPLSPADNAEVTIPFTISWSAASDPSGIAGYNWQVSATSSFAQVLRADSTLPSETLDTVSGLAPGTYFWRVQAVSNDFVSSPWSAARRVNIVGAGAGLPATPTLNQPRGGTHFHPWEYFGMSWSSISGATKYILEASKDPSFSSSGVVFRWEDPIASTSIMLTTVDMGDYKARVFAVDANGVMSMPSNVISFKISFNAPLPPPPTLVAPSGGASVSLPITFSWNHVINPQPMGYQLQISRSSNFSTIETDIGQITNPTYTLVQVPTTGTKYWRVRSFQGNDSETTAAPTAWSATGTFVVPSGPLRVNTITLSRAAPASGQEIYVDLQLSGPVPSGGDTVNLSSSDSVAAPLPSSIPVQGSTSWVQFRFWTGQVTASKSVTMTAAVGTGSPTSLTFTVDPPSLNALLGVPLRKSGGTGLGGIVELKGQAPPGGAVVSLSSSHPAVTPPATVTVPAGAESTFFNATTSTVTKDTPVTITATWKGVSVQAQSTLTPQPPPTSLTLDPATTSSSSGSWGRVTIAAPATEEVSFALSSSHPNLAQVPGWVTIGTHSTAGGFIISTVGVTTTTHVTISASGGGVTKTAVLTLEPVQPPPPPPPPPGGTDTGLLGPTANAAASGGDGNGFQTSPANAHADDGAFAVDTDSGSGTSTTCTSSSKDKHDFRDYGITVPGGAAIKGIEVRLDAKADSTSSSPKLCVQLSWNGGASWTSAKTTSTLSTSEATHTLGSATDTWGRSWTASNLTNANFRVRVIALSSSTSRDFSLDWVAVRVSY